jgi:ATP diphosphatase
MKAIEELLDIMSRLRDPETGCPWDLRQTYSTIVPYTLEEAYEVADAIQRGDMDELKSELGDLLFQVVFYSQIAREQGYFDFEQVTAAINEKMLRRHPHVFADAGYASDEELHKAWEQAKAKERSERADSKRLSELDGVARALPALIRAEKLQKRAARVGFDWPDVTGALDKLNEEISEVRAEITSGDEIRLQDELGDLLFSVVNVVRLCGMDAEQSLSMANEKFERRFRMMEQLLFSQGTTDLHELSARQWDDAWVTVKNTDDRDADET